MQGLITLDFGNSHPHAGLFIKAKNQWSLLKTLLIHPDEKNSFSHFHQQLMSYDLHPGNSSFVVSQVKSRAHFLAEAEKCGFLITTLSTYWKGQRFFGMPVHYSSTLGEDRLIEAFHLYRKKISTLIINAGTFTTIDFITSQGFEGGYIIPSLSDYLDTFKKSDVLNSFLRDGEGKQEFNNIPQNSTAALVQGYQAFTALVENLVNRYQIKKIVVTGGKMKWWIDFLQDSFSGGLVEDHPHLIHFSLHDWFTTQIETN